MGYRRQKIFIFIGVIKRKRKEVKEIKPISLFPLFANASRSWKQRCGQAKRVIWLNEKKMSTFSRSKRIF